MKRNTIVLLCSLMIVIFTAFVAFLCFKLYNQDGERYISSVEVSLKDKGKGVDVGSLYPYTDEQAEQLKPYEFEISNNGDNDAKYRVLIEEVELKDKKGYSKKELLSRSQLRYELILNGRVIKKDNMTSIKNNIIDERSIVKSKKNNYQLRVWIAQSASKTKWMGKYYHYKVSIQPVEKGE